MVSTREKSRIDLLEFNHPRREKRGRVRNDSIRLTPLIHTRKHTHDTISPRRPPPFPAKGQPSKQHDISSCSHLCLCSSEIGDTLQRKGEGDFNSTARTHPPKTRRGSHLHSHCELVVHNIDVEHPENSHTGLHLHVLLALNQKFNLRRGHLEHVAIG